ncbi:MAG TPA: alanine racemase [Acidobacteriaceae bacterium]
MTHTRPVWAEISRRKLIHNYRILQGLAGPDAQLVAVIKADAYGHGLEACARALADDGARWLGVTSVEEAARLRGYCPEARILVMSGAWQGEADAVIDGRLTPVVWDRAHVEMLRDAARRRGIGPGELPVHVEIDSGMSRQGVQVENLAALLEGFGSGSPLRVEAAMTHFHSPDQPEATGDQMRRFGAAVELMIRGGAPPEFLSAGSSTDLLDQSTGEITELAKRHGARRMVRSGLALYGYAPQGGRGYGLQPVLAWKTRVVSLREIGEGAVAGYGATFRPTRPTRLALLAVGYADGLDRGLSNRGSVLVRGQRAPIAGRISMDQTMADVTEIPGVAVGDEVALIGEQDGLTITADDLAQPTGTIAYEVLCAIGARVPRVMVD